MRKLEFLPQAIGLYSSFIKIQDIKTSRILISVNQDRIANRFCF